MLRKSTLDIQVYGKSDKPKLKQVILKLVPRRNHRGGVKVVSVDEAGKSVPGTDLVWFRPNGTICLYANTNSDLGFRRDACGRVEIEGGQCDQFE